jgi:hypothetical protein
VSQAFSTRTDVQDVSVYGTTMGFRGRAEPGGSTFVDVAAEYSMTQRWVLALDVTVGYNANTRVLGGNPLTSAGAPDPSGIILNSGWSSSFGLAPAVEYNLTSTLGVIVGIRLLPAGHNTSASITPAVAINFIH